MAAVCVSGVTISSSSRGNLEEDMTERNARRSFEWKTKRYCDALNDSINSLKELEKDELIIIASKKITITQKGKPFIRNICMALDVRMKRQKPETALFSMTI